MCWIFCVKFTHMCKNMTQKNAALLREVFWIFCGVVAVSLFSPYCERLVSLCGKRSFPLSHIHSKVSWIYLKAETFFIHKNWKWTTIATITTEATMAIRATMAVIVPTTQATTIAITTMIIATTLIATTTTTPMLTTSLCQHGWNEWQMKWFPTQKSRLKI